MEYKSISEDLLDKNGELIIYPNLNLEKESKKHFICKNCYTVPIIEWTSFGTLIYSCLCYKSKNTTENILKSKVLNENESIYTDKNNENNKNNEIICDKYKFYDVVFNNCDEFFDKFYNELDTENSGKNDENEIEKCLLSLECKKHKEKFAYFCLVCQENICRKCIRDSNKHIDHRIEIFDCIFNEIDKIIENNKGFLILKEDDSYEIKQFKELMNIIVDDYKSFPNFSHFPIIRSFEELLKKKKNEQLYNDISFDVVLLYINSVEELKLNFNNAKHINKISIRDAGQSIIYSLDLLHSDLINLVELHLESNNIVDISSLAGIKLENLKILDLAHNKIDDRNTKYFFELDFPKLEYLDLFFNYIKNPEILCLKNDKNKLPKLKNFNIGKNKFNFNKNNINDNYNFSSLIELGISGGCFNQLSIKYIKCFKLTNLHRIYLSQNDLENLDFVNNLDLPSIKEIWLNYNKLETFEPLKKYKTLEIIEMRYNNINDIENIEDFIKSFNNLRRFDLLGNDIFLDITKYLKLEEIKKNNNISILISSKMMDKVDNKMIK